MDKAFQNVSRLRGNNTALHWHKCFGRIQKMPSANNTLKRIANAPETEQLGDYLAEVLYALIFAGLEFQVEIEPYGSKGADLRVSRDGCSAIVEIMRMRKINPGPSQYSLTDDEDYLEVYGNPMRDIRKAFEKLSAKFPQAGQDDSIIAIWNNDEDLEEVDVEVAVRDLLEDASHQNLTLPSRLSFVLYGSSWVSHQQLYCFSMRNEDEPDHVTWMQELESSTVGQLVQCAISL